MQTEFSSLEGYGFAESDMNDGDFDDIDFG